MSSLCYEIRGGQRAVGQERGRLIAACTDGADASAIHRRHPGSDLFLNGDRLGTMPRSRKEDEEETERLVHAPFPKEALQGIWGLIEEEDDDEDEDEDEEENESEVADAD